MFQRLLIALTQAKAGNASENLLNKIHQIIYSLYQANEITKKNINNIVNSVKVSYKMDTLFMNSINSYTSEPHRFLLNVTYKINLNRDDKNIV